MRESIVSFFMAMAFTTTALAQSTFYVTPSGDTSGETDRANLLQAFDDAKAAGPGSVVELAAGTFYIYQIKVDEFYGTFTGAGMDETIVEAIPELPIDNPYFFFTPMTDEEWLNIKDSVLLTFGNGDYTISDMTLSLPHSPAIEPWFIGVFVQAAHGMYIVGPNANSTVERVAIEGVEDTEYGFQGFNVINTLYVQGLRPTPGTVFNFQKLTGTHVVRASRFRNASWATNTALLLDASLTIGGKGNDGNLIENVNNVCNPFNSVNSVFEFSHNRIVGARMKGFQAGNPGRPPIIDTDILVHHNDFKMVPGAVAGIEINAVDGVEIANNRVSGAGAAAISIHDSADCLILGNNVQGFVADVAGVWLDEGTSGCTVIGNPSMVFDEGTDNYVTGP